MQPMPVSPARRLALLLLPLICFGLAGTRADEPEEQPDAPLSDPPAAVTETLPAVEPPAEPTDPSFAAPEEQPAPEERIRLNDFAPPNGGTRDRISITLADVELSEAVSLFIRLSGANIITSPADLIGRVTVSLQDVPWHEALSSILDLHGLVLERTSLDAELYKIVPRPEGAPEPMFIESFTLNFSRPEPLVPGIRSLLEPNGQLLFAEGNVISILGTTRQVERVRGMIDRVDLRVPQVVIEAKFVELNDRAIRDLGVNWSSLQGFTATVRPSGTWEREDTQSRTIQGAFAGSFTQGEGSTMTRTDGRDNWVPFTNADGRPSLRREQVDTRTQGRQDGQMGMWGENFQEADFAEGSMTLVPRRETVTTQAMSAILTADEFALTLSALQSNRGVGIISNPKIIVASGQTASIHVGRQDPEIKAVADTNLGGRLTYQREGWIESGVRVVVTPVVNTDDLISVQIRPELSRVIDFQESGDTRVTIPILSTRTISSQFQLPGGKTVAIGGLTESSENNTVTKIPFLGDIPIIGRLFRHESTQREQEEVIIFVTLALADTDRLDRDSGIPTQGQLIHHSVHTNEAGFMDFVRPEPARRYRRRAPAREEEMEQPSPREVEWPASRE